MDGLPVSARDVFRDHPRLSPAFDTHVHTHNPHVCTRTGLRLPGTSSKWHSSFLRFCHLWSLALSHFFSFHHHLAKLPLLPQRLVRSARHPNQTKKNSYHKWQPTATPDPGSYSIYTISVHEHSSALSRFAPWAGCQLG
jgi:hypothetical protein